MNTFTIALLITFLAGLSIPFGALFSANKTMQNFCLRYELDSFISYFGGGALLAAIALVLIFDDIAPKAHVKYHDFPATGAVFGFLLGIIGTMIIH